MQNEDVRCVIFLEETEAYYGSECKGYRPIIVNASVAMPVMHIIISYKETEAYKYNTHWPLIIFLKQTNTWCCTSQSTKQSDVLKVTQKQNTINLHSSKV